MINIINFCKNKLSFKTNVTRGQIEFPNSLRKYLQELDGPVVVTIEKLTGNRTAQQNAFLHGPILDWWATNIGELTGETFANSDVIKAHMKETLKLGTTEQINGRSFFVAEETSKMSKKRFSEVYGIIEQFGLKWFGCNAPHPEWDYRK